MFEAARFRRPLQQQGRNFAGVAAHGHHPRARLAAVAHFGDVDAGGEQPFPGRIDIGDAPGHAPQRIACRVGMLARPVRHLDDQVAAAEKHQPAPVGMRAVERHVEAKPGAVERGGMLGIGCRDHDVVHRRDRRRRGPHRERAFAGQFEKEHPHAARGRGRRTGSFPRQASRHWRHRGFRRPRPAPASASAAPACDASWRCRRCGSKGSPVPRPAPSGRCGYGPRWRRRRSGAISSRVTLSSVNITRSAPSSPLRHAGARANSVWYAATAASISLTRTTTWSRPVITETVPACSWRRGPFRRRPPSRRCGGEILSALARFIMVSNARSRILYSRVVTSSSSQNNCCRSCTHSK